MRYLQLSPVSRAFERRFNINAECCQDLTGWLSGEPGCSTGCPTRPAACAPAGTGRERQHAATPELWRLRPEANLAGSETVLQDCRIRSA